MECGASNWDVPRVSDTFIVYTCFFDQCPCWLGWLTQATASDLSEVSSVGFRQDLDGNQTGFKQDLNSIKTDHSKKDLDLKLNCVSAFAD